MGAGRWLIVDDQDVVHAATFAVMVQRRNEVLPDTNRPLDLAPISAEPSTRLHFVALYFSVVGTLMGTMLVVVSVLHMAGMADVFARGLHIQPMQVISGMLSTAGLLWTGHELRQRRRSGWTSAIATLALPLIVSAVGRSISVSTLVTSVVGLLLVVSVRNELE